jgi:uncharacterized repeat protein (TIGR01451 family)
MAQRVRFVSVASPRRLVPLAMLVGLTFVVLPATNAHASGGTLTVYSNADTGGSTCPVNTCTLRQAISAANAAGNGSVIKFQLPAGQTTIHAGSALPNITVQAGIDGTTQPGYAGTPIVEVIGSTFVLQGASDVLQGLVLSGADNGVELRGGGATVRNNYIGTNAAGDSTTNAGVGTGILVASSNNMIGGSVTTINNLTINYGNVIAGTAFDGVDLTGGSGNVVQGNIVGLNAAGTASLNQNQGDLFDGIYVTTPNNTMTGNVISGNANDGIELDGPNVYGFPTPGPYDVRGQTITGNRIGTNAAGTAAIPNGGDGVLLNQSTNSVVGGPNAGDGNVISGNTGNGIESNTGVNCVGSLDPSCLSGLGDQYLGNKVGVNAAGTSALANGGHGLALVSFDAVVGGTSAGAGNVISGNGVGGVHVTLPASNHGQVPYAFQMSIQGNRIGTDAAGSTAVGNGGDGISVDDGGTGAQFADGHTGPALVLGGDTAAARNVVSANGHDGIVLRGVYSEFNVLSRVTNNYIGTNAAGTAALGNAVDGIRVLGQGFDVGGVGTGNVISGNGADGIDISSGQRTQAGNFVGINVLGNYVGTNAAGTGALGNAQGIFLGQIGNNVGGTDPGEGNLISGNVGSGVLISVGRADFGSPAAVLGNLIGTNAAGTGAVGNGGAGVRVETQEDCAACNSIPDTSSVVGDGTAGGRNVISGNTGWGVQIDGGANHLVNSASVKGNFIGTATNGTTSVPNQLGGVQISSTTGGLPLGGSAAGEPNTIAGNGGDGIDIVGSTGITLTENGVSNNGGIGIDLGADGVTPDDPGDNDLGANGLQNFPLVTQVGTQDSFTEIEGTLATFKSNGTYRLEFFSSPGCDPSGNGEGAAFIGSALHSGNSAFSEVFDVTVAPTDVVTATATDSQGNTSEFSPCTPVTKASVDLRVSKTVNPSSVQAGSNTTYTVRVTNLGPFTAPSVTLGDSEPTQLTVQSASTSQGSCVPKPQYVQCELGDIALNKTVTVTIVVRANRTGVFTSSATAVSDAPDPNSGNSTSQAKVTVVPAANGCTIMGTAASETINGTSGDDVICALGGNDVVNAGTGNDTIYGGAGNDTLNGGAGDDNIYGGAGNDVINGLAGADYLRADDNATAHDKVDGGADNDRDLCVSDAADTVTRCP